MPSSMRSRFASFGKKTKKDFDDLFESAEFTFDANVLLSIYESPRSVFTQFGKHLGSLGERFYLTDQAALEFYRNRQKVITRVRAAALRVDDLLEAVPCALSESARKDYEKLLNRERETITDFLKSDPVEELLSGKVGDRVDEPLDDPALLYELIEKRYAAQVPPGFADAEEKEDYKKYGDAVLWLQIIAHEKRTKKAVVLVTN